MKKNITPALAENKAPGKVMKANPGFFKCNSIAAVLIAICIEIGGFFMEESHRRYYSMGFIVGFIYTIFLYKSLRR